MIRWWRSCVALVIVFIALPASAALAHAAFLGASISDGSVISEAPETVELAFDEKVLVSASSVSLVYVGEDRNESLRLSTQNSGTVLSAQLPVLAKGQYLLRFIAVDPADLHKTVGSISFGVGVTVPVSHASEQITSSWWTALVRAVSDVLVFAIIGLTVISVQVVKKRKSFVDQIVNWIIPAASLLSVIWVALVVLEVAGVGLANIDLVALIFTSDPGRRAVIGIPLAYCFFTMAKQLRRSVVDEASLYLARVLFGLGVLLAVITSMGGHTSVGGNVFVGLIIHSLHMYSLGAWVGVLGVAWVIVKKNHEERWLWVEASRVFVWSAPMVLITGILLSGRVAVTVTSLLSTNYGIRILGKVIITLSMLCGGYMAGRNIRKSREPGFILGELAAGLVAIGIAATLATSAPAIGQQFEPLAAAQPQVIVGNSLDLTVNASLVPAQTGPNILQVRILNTRKPSPGVVQNILVTLYSGDGTAFAQRTSSASGGLIEWNDIKISTPGDVRIRVDIERPDSPVPPFASNFNVLSPPVAKHETVVSDQKLKPISQAIALLIFVCVMCIVGLGAVRSKMHRAKFASDNRSVRSYENG
jgi:methionine-rich copper-binding protein CopC/putative copper export protein